MITFQSSPSPKAGSYKAPEDEEWDAGAVSILSQPEGRELLVIAWTKYAGMSFQSSPSPKAGSYFLDPGKFFFDVLFQSSPSPKAGSYSPPWCPLRREEVSILSQPEGRELRAQWVTVIAEEQFQSSPSPKAGSYPDGRAFNTSIQVSILSQPEGRELRMPRGASGFPLPVSILSQPEGRELRLPSS